ncbi:MAG: NACHT domain-containing protein [Chloroflexi bacterium]|nr:NACHT domain-containing protein [Chloroflexota bacterium]
MRFFRRNATEYETAVSHQPNIGPLSRQIAQAFSRDEVRELCFDMSIDPDEMPEKAKTEQCAWLIEILQRAGRLSELLSLLPEKRPRYDWQTPVVPTPRDLRNRKNLLQNVQTTWIEGFLHQSLSQTIAVELNLSYRPDAVARKTLHTPGQNEDAPVNQSLLDVFQKHGRFLLILGEPGSGKTITLLQLAASLIATAQQDPSQPVPVILNLSSWAQQKQPLQSWLVEELFLQYGMARKLSRTWIEQNQLLYLLDGLDEVAVEARDACVQAINNFKAEHPVELVVCSRLADYENLQEKLNVATAVRIHPLTNDQIQTYLSHPELKLTAVRDALATDPNLNELAHSPLFLSIMTLSYHGFTREQLQSFGTLANRRKHLFDTYVDEMFRKRPLPKKEEKRFIKKISFLKRKKTGYSQHELLHCLTNLAYGMKQHSQPIFYIERLQTSWLPPTKLKRYKLAVSIGDGLISGALLGYILALSSGSIILGILAGIMIFYIIASAIWLDRRGLLFGALFKKEIKLVEQLVNVRIPMSHFLFFVKESLISGLMAGGFMGISFGFILAVEVGIKLGILFGIFIGLIFTLLVMISRGFDIGQAIFLKTSRLSEKSAEGVQNLEIKVNKAQKHRFWMLWSA